MKMAILRTFARLATGSFTAAALSLPAAAQLALDPLTSLNLVWGNEVAVRVSYPAGSCAAPSPGTILFANDVSIDGGPLTSCDGSGTRSRVFMSPGDLPFGTYRLVATSSGPTLTSNAIFLTLNPEFILPTRDGIYGTALSKKAPQSICSSRRATFYERENLPIPVPPPNLRTPYEMTTYVSTGCTFAPPAAVNAYQRVQVEVPMLAIPPGSQVWVYGSTLGVAGWRQVPATIVGRHVFFDIGGETVGAVNNTAAIAIPQRPSRDADLQDLWWADENGWGLNIAKDGEKIFATLFVYDDQGNPMWAVLPACTWDPVHHVCHGDLYTPAGSSYERYDPSQFRLGNPVGTASISFVSDDEGHLDYTIENRSGGKHLRRFVFAPRDSSRPLRYAGMWSAPFQDGWGLSIQQQGQNLFSTWYTYDGGGRVTWFMMPGGRWTSATTFTGQLFRTRGSKWIGERYNGANLQVIPVGSMTLDFTDASNATMTTVVDGLRQERRITRFSF
ncbi:MAG TPA: hypothetical protein VFK48_06695 [Usitatibacter sp.]|nr:hypothetical protein [Usitatibacter sp.]